MSRAEGRGRRGPGARCSTCSIPGPDGSIGDTDWIIAARQAGKIQTLIVQGVLHTPLADAADIVLPGSRVRREGRDLHEHDRPRAGGVARRFTPPGDAGEDWQILTKLGVVFGADVALRVGGGDARGDRAARWPACPATPRSRRSTFARPVSARHWLQASNPSERWKWDFMFQDLPPIKFGEDFGPLPRAEVIPLKEVK